MGYKFVDIGDVWVLRCVKSAAEGTCAEVVAEGTKGSIRFRLLHAYSRSSARGKLPNGEEVEWLNIRFLAFIRQLQMLDNTCALAIIENLKGASLFNMDGGLNYCSILWLSDCLMSAKNISPETGRN